MRSIALLDKFNSRKSANWVSAFKSISLSRFPLKSKLITFRGKSWGNRLNSMLEQLTNPCSQLQSSGQGCKGGGGGPSSMPRKSKYKWSLIRRFHRTNCGWFSLLESINDDDVEDVAMALFAVVVCIVVVVDVDDVDKDSWVCVLFKFNVVGLISWL